jgi:hypothetical protein
MDAIFTTDPKTRSEVEPWVDLPYGPNQIREAGGVRLGPHLAPLLPFADRLAVLNGVQVRTANHQTGRAQFHRLRTGVIDGMPGLLELIGRMREGPPLGVIHVGKVSASVYSPNAFFGTRGGSGIFETLDRTPPDELRLLGEVLRGQARKLRVSRDARHRATADNAEACAALFERVAQVPRFRPEVWSPLPHMQSEAVQLQRVLWAFEHDLSAGAVYQTQLDWDSHTLNGPRQSDNAPFFELFARFLGELDRKRNAAGPLSSSTLSVLGSELGRNPRLNGNDGKDHFPEAPLVFVGPGVRGGASYGRSGRNMAALPIASTGAPRDGGGEVTLDDVGATLLRHAGTDPAPFGYRGKTLEFLFRDA